MRHKWQRRSKPLYVAGCQKKYHLRPWRQLSELIGLTERFRQARSDNEYIDGATSIEAAGGDCRRVGFNNLNLKIGAIGHEHTTKLLRIVDASHQHSI